MLDIPLAAPAIIPAAEIPAVIFICASVLANNAVAGIAVTGLAIKGAAAAVAVLIPLEASINTLPKAAPCSITIPAIANPLLSPARPDNILPNLPASFI